jgi:phosphatidylserine decarboxylase
MQNKKDFLLKKYLMPKIHKDGIFILIVSAIVSVLIAIMSEFLGILALIFTIAVFYFFRDPDRIIPDKKNIVVAPADGIIQKIIKLAPPKELEMQDDACRRISILIRPFDVHVNRIPIEGEIKKVVYKPGKNVNLAMEKESEDNEKNMVMLETKNKKHIGITQIAGLVNRRIVCDIEEGDTLTTGQRFGIIKFGSRVDLYLPLNYKVDVKEGQTMIGGETIVAFTEKEIAKKTPSKTTTSTKKKK